jgi:signal transduction histidine kinase
MSNWRELLPIYLKWLTVSLSLVVLLCYSLAIAKPTETSGKFDSQEDYRLDRPEGWEISIGDLPTVNGQPDWSMANWESAKEVRDSQKLKRYKGYYWIKTKLPNQSVRDPHLMIVAIQSYEVYLGQDKLLSFHMPPAPPIVNENGIRKMVALDAERLNEPLYIRIYSHAKPPQNLVGVVRFGDQGDLISSIMPSHIVTFSFGMIFIVAGMVSLFLFFLRERNMLYLSFFLFGLTAGVGTLTKTSIGHWFFTPERFVYLPEIFPNLGLFALVLFLEQIATHPYKLGFRLLSLGAILYTAFTFLFIKIHFDFYYTWVIFGGPIHFSISLLAAMILLMRMHRGVRTRETYYLVYGFILNFALLSINLLYIYLSDVRRYLIDHYLWLHSLIENFLYFGIFMFMCSLAFVIYSRFAELNRKVKQYAEETSLKLEDSLRETAATLAELSVMEERNKLARDVHDIVGHTLTTTIVQIEAARMLLEKDKDKGVEKLASISTLVRKSMDDIRHSMKTLSQSSDDWNLRRALSQLLEDTETATGIHIEYDIEDTPELKTTHKKVLFHALQEGITNAIRHGECTEIHFQLKYEQGKVEFYLHNNGKRYLPNELGLGLTAMKDRVQSVGGEFLIGTHNGSGCQIRILLG